MPRQSKAKSVDTKSSSAPVTVTEQTVPVVTVPVLDTKSLTSVTETVPVVDATEAENDDLEKQSTEFFAKLTQVSGLLSSLKSEYRALEKKWTRELKVAQKSSAKRKRKSGNRQPSGFVKPTKISDELARFLEKPLGSEMARTDVTREINKYIRSQNLQDKDNGRKINPDKKLQSLLKLAATDELTYFNLQKYMSPHFAKSVKKVAA
jgi:chromatin remodeling complex protein RSC6